jgi:hypothetical protein
MISTLMRTAYSEFKTALNMATPCSVKTKGRYLGNFPCPLNGHEMMGKEDNEKGAAKDYCKNKMG